MTCPICSTQIGPGDRTVLWGRSKKPAHVVCAEATEAAAADPTATTGEPVVALTGPTKEEWELW